MRHTQHEQFIQSIHDTKKVTLRFFSKEDAGVLHRICAPMDYGAGSKIKDGIARYHVWDYFPDGGKKPHPIPLLANRIQEIIVTEEAFDPAEFVAASWFPLAWHVPRNWGRFS